MNLGPSRVLGNWNPSIEPGTNEDMITSLFRAEVDKLLGFNTQTYAGFVLVNVRRPHSFRANLPLTEVWHRDCDGDAPYSIIWSDKYPTEVKFKDGSLLDAKNGDIILVDNLQDMHRKPKFEGTDRWFIRM